MKERIITYKTKHFEFRVPIDYWNKNQKYLSNLSVAFSIAPSNLTAILLKPFYYDWNYETDGCIQLEPVVVYDGEWVGKEICHFPHCKELSEFNNWLEKQHYWHIPYYWHMITEYAMLDEGMPRDQLLTELQETYKLELSGRVVAGKLRGVGKYGSFWSAHKLPIGQAYCLDFSNTKIIPELKMDCYHALSVRCVYC